MDHSLEAGLINFYNTLSGEDKTVFYRLIHDMVEDNSPLPKGFPLDNFFEPHEMDCINPFIDKESSTKINPSQLTIILKATRLCNLRCTYCHSWKSGPNQVMPFSTLVKTLYDSLMTGAKHIEYVWHGGEVTLLPIDYLKKALILQQYFKRPGQVIGNALQTNATLLSSEWIHFIKENNISIGVSLDGPPEINDKRRLDKAGRPTFSKIKQGIELLRQHDVHFGILMVIDDDIIEFGADPLLSYFADTGIKNFALLNAIPKNTNNSSVTGVYLPWERYVQFMKELFVNWWKNYKGMFEIRELKVLSDKVQNPKSDGLCYFAGDCMGKYLTIEPDGTVFACDKYIGDKQYIFGNLLEKNLGDIIKDSTNLKSALMLQNKNKQQMKAKCDWYSVCNGSCPHDVKLNKQFQNYHAGDCCGLSGLLETIKATVVKNENYLN